MKTSRKFYVSESTFDHCADPKTVHIESVSIVDPFFLPYHRLRPVHGCAVKPEKEHA